jgi:hypothetical protein
MIVSIDSNTEINSAIDGVASAGKVSLGSTVVSSESKVCNSNTFVAFDTEEGLLRRSIA